MTNRQYFVTEKFISIDGEGPRVGKPAAFIRLSGCNLKCEYCDTTYAQGIESGKSETTSSIIAFLQESNVKNVTLTGGEPLNKPYINELIVMLSTLGYSVSIETNGSIDISIVPATALIIMDYKLPESGVEEDMLVSNFKYLKPTDVVKFVCTNEEDVERALDIIEAYNIKQECYFSPVFGKMNLQTLAESIINAELPNARMQLQLHKLIWDPNKRGV